MTSQGRIIQGSRTGAKWVMHPLADLRELTCDWQASGGDDA
jgi:hypothetical protein